MRSRYSGVRGNFTEYPKRGTTEMMTEPIEWKSAAWWRNLPEADRLSFVKIPRRIADQSGVSNIGRRRIEMAPAIAS